LHHLIKCLPLYKPSLNLEEYVRNLLMEREREEEDDEDELRCDSSTIDVRRIITMRYRKLVPPSLLFSYFPFPCILYPCSSPALLFVSHVKAQCWWILQSQ
jgi:hypothetical protein